MESNGGHPNPLADGVNVFQFGTDNADNRLWKIEPVGNGYYKLTNKKSGKVLDVSGGITATANGANVQQWSYGGGTNQHWKLEKVTAAARMGAEQITLLNSAGRSSLSQTNLSSKQVSLQTGSLPQGLYLIQALTRQGKIIARKVLISR